MNIGLTQLNVAYARSCLNAGTYGTLQTASGIPQHRSRHGADRTLISGATDSTRVTNPAATGLRPM